MPAPGDQHKANGATTLNPFEENKTSTGEYTPLELEILQSRLNKKLGPEFISTRPGPGNQKVAYLSAEKAINLANEVFGFNGWSSSIQNIQIDFIDENAQTGKVSLGLSVVVRVTLKDGAYHEDIGYGGIENCKGKSMAFEKCKKEATTDALKRALRSFGNVLGNCMYDRDFITKVSKVKAGNGRFDVNELHRHPDWVPKTSGDVKSTVYTVPATNRVPSLEMEDSFDVSEFDDIDFNESDLAHPDEVLLPADPEVHRSRTGVKQQPSSINTPSKPPQPRPQGAQPAGHPRPPGQQPGNFNGTIPAPLGRAGVPSNPSVQAQAAAMEVDRGDERNFSSPGMPSLHPAQQQGGAPLPRGPQMAPPAGFYSAKAAKDIDQHNVPNLPQHALKFNPHAESPSIRKTAGIDHTKSVPVKREMQKPDANAPPNIVDPRGDPNRRIGMPGQPGPGSAARSGMSTSAYRPPTRHGSPAIPGAGANAVLPSNAADRALMTAKRPPLGDVSNMQHNVTAITTDGADAKRQKVGSEGSGPIAPDNTVNATGNAAAGT